MAIRVISDSVQPYNRVSPDTSPHGWTDHKALVPGPSHCVVRAMAPVIAGGRLFGFFAFRGLANPKFAWASTRVVYAVVTVVGIATTVVIILVASASDPPGVAATEATAAPGEDNGTTSVKFVAGITGSIIYFGAAMSMLLLFLRFSAHWPALVGDLRRLEGRLARGDYPAIGFGSRMRNVTVTALTIYFLIEIILDGGTYCLQVVREARYDGVLDFIRELYYTQNPPARNVPGADNAALLLWLTWVKVQAKYAMVYGDLLLGTLSAVLAALFRSVRGKVRLGDFKAMSDRDWRDIRETYNEVLDVTTAANRILGPIILLTYTSGLWFICGGILLLLAGGEMDPTKRIYLLLSMSFWSLRIVLSTLAMSSVFEENRALRRHLHAVPTALYSYEVNRLTMEACHNEVGLSGMDFFTVTRHVLLTLVGTVASYEVVLMQFSR